ncbi:unnamed protein product [Paramecium sonneborni]|uniref:Uncharacterized protein n=1 Tax=Paramecium sonneborni TaxID=65129 RepID=A0A8S1KKC5_9CILI|nr:unnamed protein product [Paramecium sonneborni]
MLRIVSKKSFSSTFNVLDTFKTLKSVITAPIRHIRSYVRQDGVHSSMTPNLTYQAFDEVLHEYYAAYSGNPFHLQVYNNLDNIQTVNFGTVDNPCVIFTADTPFRYVGCTGLQNEDDYEQHEIHLFMLREGPLQRCPMCGQVFKLVRLRQQEDEEMSYYRDSFHPIDIFELDNENVQSINMFKMWTHREASLFESALYEQNIMVTMDNDVHDRLLVDPAYRMWRFQHGEDKLKYIDQQLKQAGYNEERVYRNPKYKLPMQKATYAAVIEAEKVLAIQERLERKVNRFHVREYLDFANHARRERRMRLRQKERWENNYTYFYGGLTEEEQLYNDYFETDQELYKDDEQVEQRIDEAVAQVDPKYSPLRFDFQEAYTHNPEEDQTSLLEKKLWRFKYRLAFDCTKDYQVREKRLIERHLARMTKDPEYIAVFKNLQTAVNSENEFALLEAEKNYYNLAAKEGFLQYKDYFEGDASAEIELVEELYNASPLAFSKIFVNHSARLFQQEGFQKFPKRAWNDSLGLIQNYVLDFQDFSSNIVPKAQKLANHAGLQNVLPADEQELVKLGLDKTEQIARQKIAQAQEKPQLNEPPKQAQEQAPPKVEQQQQKPQQQQQQQQQQQSKKGPFIKKK